MPMQMLCSYKNQRKSYGPRYNANLPRLSQIYALSDLRGKRLSTMTYHTQSVHTGCVRFTNTKAVFLMHKRLQNYNKCTAISQQCYWQSFLGSWQARQKMSQRPSYWGNGASNDTPGSLNAKL